MPANVSRPAEAIAAARGSRSGLRAGRPHRPAPTSTSARTAKVASAAAAACSSSRTWARQSAATVTRAAWRPGRAGQARTGQRRRGDQDVGEARGGQAHRLPGRLAGDTVAASARSLRRISSVHLRLEMRPEPDTRARSNRPAAANVWSAAARSTSRQGVGSWASRPGGSRGCGGAGAWRGHDLSSMAPQRPPVFLPPGLAAVLLPVRPARTRPPRPAHSPAPARPPGCQRAPARGR